LKNEYYTLTIRNSAGEERILGKIIADNSGTKTFTLPIINFGAGSGFTIGQNITYNFTFTPGVAGTLKFYYYDNSNSTIEIIASIYEVNETNNLTLEYSTTSTNSSQVLISMRTLYEDQLYYFQADIQHGLYDPGNFSITRYFYQASNMSGEVMPGYTEEEERSYKMYAIGIVIILTLLAVGKMNISIALVLVCVEIFVFKLIDWFYLGNLNTPWQHTTIFAIIGVVTAFTILNEIREKRAITA
jgi:hypothetical protein